MTTGSESVRAMANVAVQAAVTAMEFSAFANAMGMLIASTSMTELPTKSKATQKGLLDLRSAFGNAIVDRAIKSTGGKDDIVSIAQAVEQEYLKDLRTRFGEMEIQTAIKACPAGDMRCVTEVATALKYRGINPVTQPVQAADTAQVTAKKVLNRAPGSMLRGPHPGKPVQDTKTGIKYPSLNKFGQAVAAEYGYDPKESMIGFKILRNYPSRVKYL